MQKKRDGAEKTVRLKVTAAERCLIREEVAFLLYGDLLEEMERERAAKDGLRFTLEQLDRFAG